MKKVVLFFAVCASVALSSCGNSQPAEAPAQDTTAAVADTTAPAACDSAKADSTAPAAADSAAAPADSAAAAK